MTATLTHKRSTGRPATTRQRGTELDREFDQDEGEQDRLDADPGDDEDDDDLDDEDDEQQDADEDQESGDWDADDREDEPDEDAEEEPEQEEEDQDDDEDQYGSLEELAAAIDEAHQRSRRCHELSNQHALRAGEYLVVAKQRVGHGGFGKWVAQNIEVSLRQAERYMELYEGREELDDLNADWLKLWSMSQALARIADQRHEHDDEDGEHAAAAADDTAEQEDEAEESLAEEATGRKARPTEEEQDAEPEEEPIPSRLTAKQLRQARAAHRKRVKELPKFLKAAPIKFGRNSAGLAALHEIGAAVVRAARQAARRLHSKELEQQGVDEDLVAMALAEFLPRKLTVAKLFEPGS